MSIYRLYVLNPTKYSQLKNLLIGIQPRWEYNAIMARDTKWCQNPKCPEKKNSNQIRGIKGSKYYQSNRANGYGNGNFCTLGCYDSWSNVYIDRAIDSMGVRINEPVKVNMENAWKVDSVYMFIILMKR